jgi:hypothetical protein
MSVVVSELMESRRLTASRDGKSSTLELVCLVRGTDNETAAKNAASAFAPETWGYGTPTLWKQSITVEPEFIAGTLSHWRATVLYDTSGDGPIVDEKSFEFTTGGGTQRITQSIETVGKYPAGAPDFGGAIGVTDSGVEGVDIHVPSLTFSETYLFAEVAPSYRLLLVRMSARINAAPFRGLAAGDVLFLGADVRYDAKLGEKPWSVTYRFAAQEGRTNFTVGDITVAAKAGWDYMWVRYADEEDAGAGALVKVPSAVYIERVYEPADFSLLGIGT